MPAAPIPLNESERLESLRDCRVLDTAPDPAFDGLTRLAAELLDVPICLISLVDQDRQWFKSRHGLDASETPRSQAFCGYAIHSSRTLIIEDASRDDRTRDNPLVTGEPKIRFYAGCPLFTDDGYALGTLCVIDRKPRTLCDTDLNRLQTLGLQAAQLLSLYRRTAESERRNRSLQQAQLDLKRKNDELEQFVYSVSHDLKSPIVTQSCYLGILKEGLAEGNHEESIDAIGWIERATRRLDECVNDLLELARVGRIETELEPVQIGPLLRDLRQELVALLSQPNTELIIDDPMPTVMANRLRLTEVFENLISNAAKYGRGDDHHVTIRIGCQMAETESRVFVRDTGPGIEAKHQGRIFELFQRLHTDKADGTGIGLAIVKRIMEEVDGRVWVESAPGQGATFWLAFPNAATQ